MDPSAVEEQTSEPAGDERQSVMLKSSKPLQRFTSKEPKSVGIVLLFLGCGQFMMGIPLRRDGHLIYNESLTAFWMGALFITSGLLCIFSEKKPSKKLVTVCQCLCTVSALACLICLVRHSFSMNEVNHFFTITFNKMDSWLKHWMETIFYIELVLFLHSAVGGVLVTVMAVFSVKALRSTKTQAIVVIQKPKTEVPV